MAVEEPANKKMTTPPPPASWKRIKWRCPLSLIILALHIIILKKTIQPKNEKKRSEQCSDLNFELRVQLQCTIHE